MWFGLTWRGRMMVMRLGWVVGCWLLLAGVAPGGADGPFRFFQGRRIPLELDAGVVLVDYSSAARPLKGAPAGALRQVRRGAWLLPAAEAASLKAPLPNGRAAALPGEPGLRLFPVYRNPATGRYVFIFDELVVRLRGGEDEARTLAGLAARGLKLLERDPFDRRVFLLRARETPGGEILKLANALHGEREGAGLAWAEVNFYSERQQLALPNDVLFPRQWHLQNTGAVSGVPWTEPGAVAVAGADVNAVAAWELERGRPAVVIGFLDDGLDLEHEDLVANVFHNSAESLNGEDSDGNGFVDDVSGWDFCDDDNDPRPSAMVVGGRTVFDSHGTAVVGIAAAAGDNFVGGSGIAPGCRVFMCKIFDRGNHCGDFKTAQAMRYASQYADVISNSWGGGLPSEDIASAVQYAQVHGRGGKGCPVFFSAGNDSRGLVLFPSSLPWAAAVGASDPADRRFSYSSYGQRLSFMAPAGNWTTDVSGWGAGYDDGDRSGNYTGVFSGTSAACPLAAGVGALLLSLEPELTANQVVALMQGTAVKAQPATAQYNAAGFSLQYGQGRIDAGRALAAAAAVGVAVDDGYEENDAFDEATTLPRGFYKGLVSRDEDWYVVALETGQELRATVHSLPELHDLNVELYEAGGVLVDGSYSTGTTESVDRLSSASERYYLRVFAEGGAYGGHGYALDLTVIAPDDAFEDNDTSATAAALVPGVYDGLQLYDDDYYRLEVTTGTGVIVWIEFTHIYGDLDLSIYDGEGVRIGVSNSISNNERVAAIGSQENAVYYLHVYGYHGATNAYRMRIVELLPPEEDEYEENDLFEEAAVIGLGRHRLTCRDNDWFRIDVAPGEGVFVRLDFEHDDGDLDCVLYDQRMNVMDSSLSADDFEELEAEGGRFHNWFYIYVYGWRGAVNTYEMTVERSLCEHRFGCFLDRLYLDVLGRAADAGGREYHLDRLCQGTVSPAGAALELTESPEHQELSAFVARAYCALLNDNSQTAFGAPDYQWLDYESMLYWREALAAFRNAGALDAGKANLLAALLLDERLRPRIAGLSDAEFVAFLYRSVLGREPDMAGYGDHLGLLAGGVLAREELARNFVESPEAVDFFQDAVLVNGVYLSLLGRSPDGGGFGFYVRLLETGELRPLNLMQSVIGSPEYQARMAELGCGEVLSH